VDWDTGWQSDLSPHKQNTSVPPTVGSEQHESSEHSDSQHYESRKCWSVASLGAAE
jgi:hypothetical protein